MAWSFTFRRRRGSSWHSARPAVTSLIGLVFLFAPGIAFRAARARSARRAAGRLCRGALDDGRLPSRAWACGAVLAQPMVYLALGAAFALAAFGRILSMLSDSGNTARQLVLVCCPDRAFGPAARPMSSASLRRRRPTQRRVRHARILRKIPARGCTLMAHSWPFACCESRYPMLDEPRLVGEAGRPACLTLKKYSNKFKMLGFTVLRRHRSWIKMREACARGRHIPAYFRCCRKICVFAFRSRA